MSDIIELLPDSVANQIAAGEVIQRPASVIKELIENSVDAGAENIDVIVVDAGRTSIQVIDDGKGMSETDARLAFERHATSKIRKADDLFSLRTMGFRGEALPSIAAVSQVELKTRLRGDDVGTHLSISGSRFQSQEPCSCPEGSNFMIENLFFNVPARRKFLKSNATELNNIIGAFERIALVYPHIHFTLHSNATELFNLRPSRLLERIVGIFGKKMSQDLLPVKVDTTLCRIDGFVGKPQAAKKKGAHQYFFTNGRYMKHPYFNKAVQVAFDRLVPSGEQVPYFLYFDVKPENIDVNIHPTKTEIKFDNEQAIFQILLAAVRDAVGKFNDIPSIDFDTEGRPDIPVFEAGNDAFAPKINTNPQYNPFHQQPVASRQSVPKNWSTLYEGLKRDNQQEASLFSAPQHDAVAPQPSGGEEPTLNDMMEEKSPMHYQYKGLYIMTAVKSGLMIIDQHRAHVRILYEQYLKQLREHKPQSQRVLFPEMVQFPRSDAALAGKILTEMTAMGFELTDMGGGSFAINATPTGLDGLDLVKLVGDMAAAAREKGSPVKDDIDHTLALSLARNAAIPQGQVLSNDEMDNMINELFACSNVNYTPDGKPIIGILRQQEIDHLFA